MEIEEQDLVADWPSGVKQAKVAVDTPKRGTKKDVVQMANNNAALVLKEQQMKLSVEHAKTLGAVEELGKYLYLPKPPNRMECFDISHIQGAETVASMVVFEGGIPKKSDYRRYKIKTAEGKPDDFKSMREVVGRRYGEAL